MPAWGIQPTTRIFLRFLPVLIVSPAIAVWAILATGNGARDTALTAHAIPRRNRAGCLRPARACRPCQPDLGPPEPPARSPLRERRLRSARTPARRGRHGLAPALAADRAPSGRHDAQESLRG